MKLEYAVHIERLAEGDGGGYLAVVPDLPGCMSDGETVEEAIVNDLDAMRGWMVAIQVDGHHVSALVQPPPAA